MTTPLYQTAFETILRRIAEGTYSAGSLLPSEFELADDLGISQGTARKAVMQLEAAGIVTRKQGRGTFVTIRRPEDSLFHFFRLRDAEEKQVYPTLEEEKITRRVSTHYERSELFDQPAEIYEVTRVRGYNQQPVTFETSVLPASLFPGLNERGPLPNTMYVLFQNAYSCLVIEAKESLKAEILDPILAQKFKCKTPIPVIVGHRKTRDILGRTIELRKTIYITQDTTYAVDMR